MEGTNHVINLVIVCLILELVLSLQPLRRFVDIRNVGDESSHEHHSLRSGDRDIAALLEKKYKFKINENSTRFKVMSSGNDSGREKRNKKPVLGRNSTKTHRKHDQINNRIYFAPVQQHDTHSSNRWELTRRYAAPEIPKSQDKGTAWFRSFAMRRIVGGMETSISMYPYNVAISRNGKHWCGGSIIDEQWVFTAAHCFESAHDGDPRKLQPFIIRAGSSFHNRGGYQARVNKVFFPENYTPGGADFDYSLLRLDRPMPVGRNIAVLNLPSKDYIVNEEDVILVTGWGSTDNSGVGRIPERLRFVPVPVMKQDECQKSYRFYITPRMLCAGYATGGKDACNHDSGGPAVRDGVLLGIVSFGGKKCGDPRSPGVYARVSQITDWVQKTVYDNEATAVPELQAKIEKAKKRMLELRKFKAHVEDKKNKIKKWLRATLKSPTFIELARKKLKESGVLRRTEVDVNNVENLDDNAIDEINLNNMINEKIIESDGESPEVDRLLRTLVIQDYMLNDVDKGMKVLMNTSGDQAADGDGTVL